MTIRSWRYCLSCVQYSYTFVIQVWLRMKDICDIMYTHMGNYIICLLIDGIFAKISNINIIKQKHLVSLCQDFELFVKFKIYKIKWYKGGLGGGGVVKTEEEKVEQSHKVQVITLTCIYWCGSFRWREWLILCQ